jgi:hypothetical protein
VFLFLLKIPASIATVVSSAHLSYGFTHSIEPGTFILAGNLAASGTALGPATNSTALKCVG